MESIKDLLDERKAEGSLRTLRPVSFRRAGRISTGSLELVDLSSNDYLGLADHPRLIERAASATEEFGTGASASRLLGGGLELHHRLEEATAKFKGKESSLVFNSGYQANVGIISALLSRGGAIFSDKLNHASIVDGMLLSGAKIFRFRHNDLGHLESLLKKERASYKEALIVTETVFSMDGDVPDLKGLVRLKERYGCMLMVDEAHATGIFGPGGAGIASREGLSGRVDLIMGTFSKALGSFGAYLASSKKITDYLVNTCRSFIYTTALPPGVIAANLAALEVVEEEPWRRERLLENSEYFRQLLKDKGFDVKGSSQIIPLIMGDNDRAVRFAEYLKTKGYMVFPIRPPTVPKGESRLRFSLTANHEKQVLKALVEDICNAGI